MEQWQWSWTETNDRGGGYCGVLEWYFSFFRFFSAHSPPLSFQALPVTNGHFTLLFGTSWTEQRADLNCRIAIG